MFSVDRLFQASIEVKHSKFIAHLMPLSLYASTMDQLRRTHPKAVHWVSAHRALNEHQHIIEYSSDDGEPRGTSGKPTLAVLQGHDLIHVALICVRYFGGIKLGPGGLVRAYSDAANAVITHATLLPYSLKIDRFVRVSYPHYTQLEYHIQRLGCDVCTKEFLTDSITLHLRAPAEDIDTLLHAMGRKIEVIEHA